MDPCRFGHVLHDNISVRLGENDGGSVVVVTNSDAGLVLLFAVAIDMTELELIPVPVQDAGP